MHELQSSLDLREFRAFVLVGPTVTFRRTIANVQFCPPSLPRCRNRSPVSTAFLGRLSPLDIIANGLCYAKTFRCTQSYAILLAQFSPLDTELCATHEPLAMVSGRDPTLESECDIARGHPFGLFTSLRDSLHRHCTLVSSSLLVKLQTSCATPRSGRAILFAIDRRQGKLQGGWARSLRMGSLR